jgi:uncharacterized protein (DUF983 family)
MKNSDVCIIIHPKNFQNRYKMMNIAHEPVSIKYALLNAKCARCREGDMFKPGLLSQKMHERCSTCDLFFERHPGYFYVAMFVSYALAVAEIITFGVATYVLSGGSENVYLYLTIILSAVVLLAPFNYKFSRVLHMHFLDPGLKYQPDFTRKHSLELKKEDKTKNVEVTMTL